jgi:hypothetical protein
MSVGESRGHWLFLQWRHAPLFMPVKPRADGRSSGVGAGKWIRRLASASLTRIQVITHANKNGEILRRGRMLNLEIVEVNRVIEEHNPTADLSLELLLSVFGKKIL